MLRPWILRRNNNSQDTAMANHLKTHASTRMTSKITHKDHR